MIDSPISTSPDGRSSSGLLRSSIRNTNGCLVHNSTGKNPAAQRSENGIKLGY